MKNYQAFVDLTHQYSVIGIIKARELLLTIPQALEYVSKISALGIDILGVTGWRKMGEYIAEDLGFSELI
jgi:hypothetical protein